MRGRRAGARRSSLITRSSASIRRRPIPTSARNPFDAAFCAVVEELKPEVISFHFGLPPEDLFKRVKALGCVTMCSATTVAEARWLEAHGVDVIIAQGFEAGGHRGIFLSDDLNAQVGTFALVPQIVDAVKLPVIAAGAVSDARGIAAAFMLGAAGVQVGSAYLALPGVEGDGAASRRACHGAGRRHPRHQSDDRAAGARLHQPRDARHRPDLGARAGSFRWRAARSCR